MYYIIVSGKMQALFYTFEIFSAWKKPPAGIPGGRFRNVPLFLQILLQRLEGLVTDVVLDAAGVVLGHLVAHADLL